VACALLCSALLCSVRGGAMSGFGGLLGWVFSSVFPMQEYLAPDEAVEESSVRASQLAGLAAQNSERIALRRPRRRTGPARGWASSDVAVQQQVPVDLGYTWQPRIDRRGASAKSQSGFGKAQLQVQHANLEEEEQQQHETVFLKTMNDTFFSSNEAMQRNKKRNSRGGNRRRKRRGPPVSQFESEFMARKKRKEELSKGKALFRENSFGSEGSVLSVNGSGSKENQQLCQPSPVSARRYQNLMNQMNMNRLKRRFMGVPIPEPKYVSTHEDKRKESEVIDMVDDSDNDKSEEEKIDPVFVAAKRKLCEEPIENELVDRRAERDGSVVLYYPDEGHGLSHFAIQVIRQVWDRDGAGNIAIAKDEKRVLHRKDFWTLRDGNWLNDEIINYVLRAFQRALDQERQNVLIWGTQFYIKLCNHADNSVGTRKEYSYENVKRWTKKMDIFRLQKIIIPVHEGNHWAMLIIDMKKRHLFYFDSFLRDNRVCVQFVKNWLKDEHQDKRKQPLKTSEWDHTFVKEIPTQTNDSDCGIFALLYAINFGQNGSMNFESKHIPYYRRLIVIEAMKRSIFG